MKEGKKLLTFIGARGGSKGLKDKNVLDFAGKPLISWTINASLQSKYLDYTLVSTDSEKIAEISSNYGAQVPFLRPASLSEDKSNIYDAIRHAVDWLKSNEIFFDYVVLLQPTQPLRPKGFLDNVIDYYFQNKKSNQDSLITVKEVDPKFNLLMEICNDNYIRYINLIDANIVNRQQLKKLFLVSGVVYIASTENLLKGQRFDFGNVLYYITDELVSSDIDTKCDFDQALKNLELLRAQGRI